MQDTILIQLTNKKAAQLIRDMEELDLIKVIDDNVSVENIKLSEKYKNVFSKEDALSFDEHTQNMRKEWNNI
ncbi:MAG: hypothetical protein IPK18_08060 [Sphingobacteriales bacterium]|jgi:hypothetical protein|nr:MAG: hypothetical protein IPK18_08060 [Sphingobacteriales bacterium]